MKIFLEINKKGFDFFMELGELNLLLWKGWCFFILGGFMIINSYCKDEIKYLQKRRKQYNLLSINHEVDLSDEEEIKLEQLMLFYGYSDANSYLRSQLKKVV